MKGKLLLSLVAISGLGCASANYPGGGAVFASSTPNARAGKAMVAAEARRAPGVPESQIEENTAERELTYEGEARIVTDDLSAASKAIRQKTKELGGYLFSMSSTRLDLRIPAKHLEDFIGGLNEFGQLKSSSIQAEDVTDKHFDLRVRISNAEQLRQRLLLLSAKSKNVEEALKLERELARVTAELERMKGLLNKSADKVKFSRLVVHMSSPEPAQKSVFRVPFSWVNNLAENLRNSYTPKPKKGGWFSTKIKAELPEGFASFYNYENSYWAMNGQGGYYNIRRVENQVPDGGLKFWKQTVSKYLREGKLMNIESVEDVASDSGKGFQISASYGAGKNKMSYILQVVPGEDKILVSEIWGVAGDISENSKLLKEAMINVKSSL